MRPSATHSRTTCISGGLIIMLLVWNGWYQSHRTWMVNHLVLLVLFTFKSLATILTSRIWSVHQVCTLMASHMIGLL